MTQKDKSINVKSSVVVKKSPNCIQITHKTIAGLSDEEAIERNTVGNFGDEQTKDKEEQS